MSAASANVKRVVERRRGCQERYFICTLLLAFTSWRTHEADTWNCCAVACARDPGGGPDQARNTPENRGSENRAGENRGRGDIAGPGVRARSGHWRNGGGRAR